MFVGCSLIVVNNSNLVDAVIAIYGVLFGFEWFIHIYEFISFDIKENKVQITNSRHSLSSICSNVYWGKRGCKGKILINIQIDRKYSIEDCRI